MRDRMEEIRTFRFFPLNAYVACLKTSRKILPSLVAGPTLSEVPPHDEAGRKPDHVRLRRVCDVDDAGCRITSDVEILPGLFRMSVVHDGPKAAFAKVGAADRQSWRRFWRDQST